MNNENNNLNTETNTNTVPVVNDRFMAVNDISQISQTVPATDPIVSAPTPVINPVQPQVEPVTTPIIQTQVEPVTTPIVQENVAVQAVNTEPVINSTPTPVINQSMPQDNNAMVNENLKKVEIKDYTPPSKLKVWLLIFFFIFLVAFIIFLPQISSLLSNRGNGVNYQKGEVVTTGELICSLDTNTTDLDKEYELVFKFSDTKLKKDKFVITTRGDSTTESSLDELAEKCNTLKSETEGLDGFSIKCDYSDGKLVETQNFDLETMDTEKLNAAFTEAGGMLPTYQYDQNIDGIEKTMKASGYTCERRK